MYKKERIDSQFIFQDISHVIRILKDCSFESTDLDSGASTFYYFEQNDPYAVRAIKDSEDKWDIWFNTQDSVYWQEGVDFEFMCELPENTYLYLPDEYTVDAGEEDEE